MTLTMMDWFCGAGGSSQGADAVPGVAVSLAANHWDRAIETHAANFPHVDHYQGDIRDAPVDTWPVADLFWASPECPQWSNARGKRRDFADQPTLPGLEPGRDAAAERSRALMDEVPQYLAGVASRGGRVAAGVVENVVEVRAWTEWDRWLRDIRNLGYDTRVIALNSMHAASHRTPRAPQSRDRLYVAYWHRSLGRAPDWDKWLRPDAECGSCGTTVAAIQSWKRNGADMGRYRTQYVYRCPRTSCRGQVVEPTVMPAATVIDWSVPAQRIGDRDRPLAPKTLGRIAAGIDRYVRPAVLRQSGVPALIVPVEGRDGKEARPSTVPMRTQTARNETGVAFVVELRGGSSTARPVTVPTATITASGNHLGIATATTIDLDDVRFRMLQPHEIQAAMAFFGDYLLAGSKRDRVRQLGNAVTPPVAEVMVSALVEAVTGEELHRG